MIGIKEKTKKIKKNKIPIFFPIASFTFWYFIDSFVGKSSLDLIEMKNMNHSGLKTTNLESLKILLIFNWGNLFCISYSMKGLKQISLTSPFFGVSDLVSPLYLSYIFSSLMDWATNRYFSFQSKLFVFSLSWFFDNLYIWDLIASFPTKFPIKSFSKCFFQIWSFFEAI